MDSRQKDRKTLKSYFLKGSVPTEEQFAELIDSTPNIREDGVVRSLSDEGLRLFPAEGKDVLATVYAENPEHSGATPLWRFTLGEDGNLEVRDNRGEAVAAIGRNKPATVDPEPEVVTIRANGLWQELPLETAVGAELGECRVYRISACYLNRRDHTHSFCEAVVSHSAGQKRKIWSPQRHWWGWSGRIKIRWRERNGKPCLQIKSKGARSGAESIGCRIDTLWRL